MGGIACQVERNAMLQFSAIPTGVYELKEFDKQLRACFTLPHIVDGIEANGTGMQVCALLWKYEWTLTDRTQLYDYLEALW